MKLLALSGLALLLICGDLAFAGDWSEPVLVRRRAEPVVTYRAKLDGDLLVVEVTHAKGWHTYAMDNVERARAKTGKEIPETELPTRIAISDGLEVSGKWRQTIPEDLSQEVIQWYTWGFSTTGHFAVPVARTNGDFATLTINAQACNASSCQMVDAIVLTLPLTEEGQNDEDALIALDDLVEVATNPSN